MSLSSHAHRLDCSFYTIQPEGRPAPEYPALQILTATLPLKIPKTQGLNYEIP